MDDYVSTFPPARSVFSDPRLLYYYFNRSTRQPAMRRLVAKTVAMALPKSNDAKPAAADSKRLREDGILRWDMLLDSAKVEAIRNFLAGKPLYDTPAAAGTQGKSRYLPKDVVMCKELMEIANHANIIALVTGYLGGKPTITLMEACWTRAATETFPGGMYQRDAEDFRFLKLFVYLTDVTEHTGAHAFIRGSHNSAALTARWPISDAEANKAFPAADHLVITGKAGAGFLEDTWGVHRSLPVKQGERLLFSVTYGLTSFNPQSPAKPVGKNLFGFNRYVNRVYLS